MTNTTLVRVGRMLLLLTIQIFILNRICLWGYVTPLLIGYMILCFERGASRIGLLLWGFLTGLLFDVFSNTAGMGSAACTLLAMTQPSLLELLAPREASESFRPTMETLGLGRYFVYAMLSMLVLHTVFFLLDAFTLQDLRLTLAAILGSSTVASLLCVFAEMFARRKQQS